MKMAIDIPKGAQFEGNFLFTIRGQPNLFGKSVQNSFGMTNNAIFKSDKDYGWKTELVNFK